LWEVEVFYQCMFLFFLDLIALSTMFVGLRFHPLRSMYGLKWPKPTLSWGSGQPYDQIFVKILHQKVFRHSWNSVKLWHRVELARTGSSRVTFQYFLFSFQFHGSTCCCDTFWSNTLLHMNLGTSIIIKSVPILYFEYFSWIIVRIYGFFFLTFN